jgi:hypothetical protein
MAADNPRANQRTATSTATSYEEKFSIVERHNFPDSWPLKLDCDEAGRGERLKRVNLGFLPDANGLC